MYFKQLLRGLDFIHRRGFRPVGLKPASILLTRHCTLTTTNLGNSREFQGEDDPITTDALPYLAPEENTLQLKDVAGDICVRGVIDVTLRTGKPLWDVAKADDGEYYEKYLKYDGDGYPPVEELLPVSLNFYFTHS